MRYLIILILTSTFSCRTSEHREYGSEFDIFETHVLQIEDLREASGIAASSVNKEVIYSINDSGNKAEVYMFNYRGEDLGKIVLNNIENRDWEDIVVGPGPDDKSYIYIAEMGDNLAQYDTKYILRLKEEKFKTGLGVINEMSAFDSIRFVFPDGRRDAETLLLEPATKDLYVISKREETVGIYLAKFPQSTTELITLEKVGHFAAKNVVAGNISVDGTEVILKTYEKIYYWSKPKDQPVYEVINTVAPKELPYEVEPQGESITWHPDGDGYITLSEEPRGIESSLYFYKRKK